MIKLNSLILNGKSSASFPFKVFVEEVPGLALAKKKDKVYEHDFMNGATKQTINAWESIPLQFVFYLHDTTRADLRLFKSWFKNEGTLVRYDDPDFHINYLSVEVESSPLDETYGYEVTATFMCEPFEYEEEKEITLGAEINNHTSSPMYPLIKITGDTASETSLSIGSQTMYFKQGVQGTITVECKHGKQNVKDSTGRLMNNQTRGSFFEIPVGKSKVVKGQGITEVKMLTRWGWL